MPLAAGIACRLCGTPILYQTVEHNPIISRMCQVCDPTHVCTPAGFADGRITDYPYCPHCDRADCPTGCRICRTIPRRNY